MARLIPRKQIEEQQDISGSLRIGGDLIVTGSSLFSGSLQVDNDFFLGNELTDRGEITGSVFLTGSLILDGELNLANLTRLSATASNSLLSEDTILYDGIRSRDFGANLPTLYVSSTDGDDSNDGRSIQYPLRTIKKAASLATPGYDGRYGFDTGSVFNGYVIKVQAGTYLEDNPVILPKNTSIWGAGLRITKINAKNPEQDLFYVNSGCYIAEVTMGGLRLWPDQINPERGFAVAFQPGAFITTSPYIQNCSQISNQENSFTELYEDIPPGGGGLYVNGDVVDPDSPLASMVLDAYTQISPNGVGCLVNGRGFIQLVSFFNNFSYYSIRVNNGGHATLNNSNISFGLYGMYASGSRFISGSGGNIAARDSVRGTWSCVVDVLNKGLENGLPTITKLNTDEGIRLTSPTLYTQSRVPATTTLSTAAADEISSDYKLISEIVDKGVSNFPTLLAKSSIKGYGFDSPYNILGAQQITSSISATQHDLNTISASYGALLSILANGTGSFNFKSNTSASRQIGSDVIQEITNVATNYTSSVSSSFGTVINIITKGVSVKPTYVANTSSSIKAGNIEQTMLGVTSSLATINSVSASFSIVYNILANGTGSNILPIPANHQKSFTITNNNSSSFNFEGIGNNPTLTLFRGETYKFNVDAVEDFGGIEYPFWIRTQQLEGITERYDYNIGVVNNGDSKGTITFTVPYNAPNRLYYVSQNKSSMGGVIEIVNSSTTPFDLIKNTLTYPATIQSGSIAKTGIDIVTAHEILTNNKSFIQEEVIEFVSSSWADFVYDEATCRRDVGYIVDGVTKDLLFGGNEESIRNGLFYYQYPSEATTTQLGPTLTAIKHAAGVSLNLIRGKVYVEPSTEAIDVWDAIRDNKTFVQNEVITYLSSSWSNFYYNEAKCRRDTGYILDAVATDAKYGGNERSIIAGEYYYQYPSLAIVRGDGDGVGQLGQTSDGIRYASGLVDTLLKKITFQAPSATTLSAYNNLINNKELIQNETIQFINVSFPNLKYNQATCKRDVGYIVDNIATDLLYGGIERGVTAGRYYYDYPSLATTTQRTSTIAGVKYAKIIGDTIVQNQILDTPRIVFNDEKNFRLSGLTNQTSSFSGSVTQQNYVSSSFNIIESIVKRGISVIPSILAQNNGQNWSNENPLNITNGVQITSATSSANLTSSINTKFDIITSIIQSGSSSSPAITSSQSDLIIVSGLTLVTASSATQAEANLISSSIGTIINIVQNGTGSIPTFQSNTSQSIKVTNVTQWTGSNATQIQATAISSSVETIKNIIKNGLGVVPTITLNTSQSIKVTNTPQYISASFSGSSAEASLVSASISLVVDILSGKSGVTSSLLLPTSSYATASIVPNVRRAYNLLKQNIPFIQAETIAYLSSSWNGFVFNDISCSRDIGLIVSGAAEDLLFGSYSSSLVNGKYYLEYPSAATGSQLNQTVDGIKYASKLAQKTLQNIIYSFASTEVQNASLQLKNNRAFIQSESIAYLSSSWSNFPFTASVCARDLGHIIDAVRTDLVYGGNERSVNAGKFYYLYPSQATGSQLIQTIDGIDYAGRITQKIVVGTTFTTASQNKTNASNLISLNKNLIAKEVVEYVSSSWYGVSYNQAKCERDVKYILDAVRTDLVYGGNERTSIAGLFYYLYPSAATVGGVPSVTNQLDPTITGIKYGSGLAQKIVLGNTFVTASKEKINVRNLVQLNRAFIQAETIQYTNAFYPNLIYNQASCSRDVGFIVDSVATDIVYGGNERSVESGVYYYKFPSKATSVEQKGQTIDSIDYANNLVNKLVSNTALSTVNFSTNTDGNIKVTNTTQYTSSLGATTTEVNQISSSFELVTTIIENGVTAIPTIVENGNGLIKVTNTIQYSSSISASGAELDIITSSFKHVADIIEKGVSFVPDSLARNYNYGFELSTPTLLHISSKEQTIGTGSYNLSTQITNVSSSYGNVVNVVKNGLSVLPTLIASTSSSLKVTNANPIRQATSASSFDTNKIASGFDLILSVIENGTSVLPTIVSNTSASIKVTNTPQIISGSAAGRLQGKLISSSLSLVIDVLLSNGTSSIGLKQSTFPIANSNAKINSAYNLLVSNSKFIVDETIAYMSSSWSGFDYTQSKCERDLTGILSGSAFDLLYGGNSASLFNGKFYFDFPSQATGSQLDQTITAIKYASGLAEKVVLNTVFTHISASINQPTSASWNSLRNNKTFIQSESIAYLSSSWSNFDYNETTCKRDIGYVIDAVATDLLYGGNERSVVAGRYYYDYPSQATNAQLEPTLTGVRYAKGTAMNVVVNKEVFTSSLETQYAYDLIKSNKLFIQSESIAFVNAKYPNLQYSESKCYRDLGYIIDGVATDLLYGGNERSRDNADYYYQFPSQANGSGSQVVETVEAIKYAARITTASISSTLIGAPSVIPNTLANIKVTNTNQYISASSATSTEATILSASIAIVTNIIAKGTGSAIVSASLSLPTSSYTTPVSNDTRWIAYGILKNNISFIQDETIAYLSSSWSTASYDESKCRRDVGLIISGAAEDLVFNSNSASLVNGKFYYDYPSQAQGAQLNQTLDGINYASKLAQKVIQNVTYVTASVIVSASYALIRKNREFIQNETIAYLSSSWSTASYIETTCKRDVGHIIDAVSTDLLYGGNERSTNAGVFYYLYPSQAQGAQLQPTLTGVKYAGQLSKNTAASLTFVTASQIVSASVNLLRKNREFIQNETLAYLTASWSTFEYDKDKCKRDVGYILDGVTTDLLYGGNERTVLNGKFYYEYPSLAIVEGDGDGVGQLGQTIDGINYAGRIAQKIVQNTQFVTASLQASASFDLLRKNKAFIAEETIAYVSSSWSSVYYNEATCKRDVGYLIDAAATDVLYGGTERSVIAGQYYYLYPSNATNKGVPSTQNQSDPTLTGIRYAGRLSKKVITNPIYSVPSASLLTTAKLLTDNKQLIQKETITFLSASWSGLKYNEVSCSRDLGFIIDAIRTDLVYGGNERSIEAGSYYYKFPSVAIVESYGDNNGQKKQTVDGINFARGLSEKIVANTLLTYLAPSTLRRQAAERLKGGKEELKQRAIGYTNGAFPYLVYNEASCSRDTGFIVDACVTDLLYGGNERGIRAASSYYDGQYGSAIAVTRDQLLETLETNRYLRTRAEFIAAGAPLEAFGSLIVATGIDYSYNGSGVTFKALPPNQGGSGVPNPIFEITELGGGRIFFTSGNQDGDFRIGTGLSINQATGTLVGRTFSKSLFSLVTPFSLALQI
jgi:hypothetical protein